MLRVRASKSATLRASAARETAGEFCCAQACTAKGLPARNRKTHAVLSPSPKPSPLILSRYLVSTARSSLMDGRRAVAPIIAMYFRFSTRQVSSSEVTHKAVPPSISEITTMSHRGR